MSAWAPVLSRVCQAITALAHLRACVLYFLDPSEECGHTLEQQLSLFEVFSAHAMPTAVAPATRYADIDKSNNFGTFDEDRVLCWLSKLCVCRTSSLFSQASP